MVNSFKEYYGQKIDLDFNDENIYFSPEDEDLLKNHAEGLQLINSNNETIIVGEFLNSGGEGDIYNCDYRNQHFVIKIYKKEIRKKSVQKKIELLVNNNPRSQRLCWPESAVYYNGKFVGYIMPFVKGKLIQYLTTGNNKKIMQRYPNYTKKAQIKMILDFLKEVEKLHSMGVLLGDINTRNIMFDPSTFDITLVDLDSVQIGQFPCTTTTPGYDAPEIVRFNSTYGKNDDKTDLNSVKKKNENNEYLFNEYYGLFYRTPFQEYHAVSVLLFEILTNGCKPYTYFEFIDVNDERYEDVQICAMESFPYGLTINNTNINCTRKEIWSHVPSFLKKAFVNNFTGKKRLDIKEWIVLFEYYYNLLNQNKINDIEANVVFPENIISYDIVSVEVIKNFIAKGFTMAHAVARAMKNFNDNDLNSHLLEASIALKNKPKYNIGKYKFSLIYNIGILKKIKIEKSI